MIAVAGDEEEIMPDAVGEFPLRGDLSAIIDKSDVPDRQACDGEANESVQVHHLAAIFGQEPWPTTNTTNSCVAYHLSFGIDGNRRTTWMRTNDAKVRHDAVTPQKCVV